MNSVFYHNGKCPFSADCIYILDPVLNREEPWLSALIENFIFFYKVTAVVNLDGGKIVTVQKAKKDGEKSTKVNMITMMTLMIVMICHEHYETVD